MESHHQSVNIKNFKKAEDRDAADLVLDTKETDPNSAVLYEKLLNYLCTSSKLSPAISEANEALSLPLDINGNKNNSGASDTLLLDLLRGSGIILCDDHEMIDRGVVDEEGLPLHSTDQLDMAVEKLGDDGIILLCQPAQQQLAVDETVVDIKPEPDGIDSYSYWLGPSSSHSSSSNFCLTSHDDPFLDSATWIEIDDDYHSLALWAQAQRQRTEEEEVCASSLAAPVGVVNSFMVDYSRGTNTNSHNEARENAWIDSLGLDPIALGVENNVALIGLGDDVEVVMGNHVGEASLPAYLMAGGLGSPSPTFDYDAASSSVTRTAVTVGSTSQVPPFPIASTLVAHHHDHQQQSHGVVRIKQEPHDDTSPPSSVLPARNVRSTTSQYSAGYSSSHPQDRHDENKNVATAGGGVVEKVNAKSRRGMMSSTDVTVGTSSGTGDGGKVRATRSTGRRYSDDSPTGMVMRSTGGGRGRGRGRPLVERQKRHSDDDNDSMDSNISETPTDLTDGSATDGSNTTDHPRSSGRTSTDVGGARGGGDVTTGATASGSLPSLPRIPAVTFASTEHSKRQRRDVSMSAPAVAARELRLKKKQREEQLINECTELKLDAEAMERETREARSQLDRLREDAAYLRSLVKSQASAVNLLQYLQKAPFFGNNNNSHHNHGNGRGVPQDGNSQRSSANANGLGLNLDARSVLRQISGATTYTVSSSSMTENTPTPAVVVADGQKNDGDKDIGGICLHINGANITLHLCSHCSSEASNK